MLCTGRWLSNFVVSTYMLEQYFSVLRMVEYTFGTNILEQNLLTEESNRIYYEIHECE